MPPVVDDVVYAGSADQRVYALDAIMGHELWSFATNGAVNSTPAVADGVVYVGSNDNHLYALDAATGDMLWSHDTWSLGAVHAGRKRRSGLFDCPDRRRAQGGGPERLVRSTGLDCPAASRPGPEFSLTVAGGLVYVPGTDFGELHALEAATGEIAWDLFSGQRLREVRPDSVGRRGVPDGGQRSLRSGRADRGGHLALRH